MKRIIFLVFSLVFSGIPRSFAAEIDGALDTSLGLAGYIDWTSSVDVNALQIIKLSDGRYLHFGSSAVTGNSPIGCETATTIASAYKTDANGEVISDFGNGVPGAFQSDLDNSNYFASAVEDQNGDIFFLGVSQRVTPVVTTGGIGCQYSNRKIYITKVSRDGELDLTFGESGIREIVESSGDGYPSYLSILDNRTILVSFHEDSLFDLLSLNLDGTLNSSFGNSGKVKLIKSEMRVFKSVQVDSTIILFGDKFNSDGDGSNRWAISSVDLVGNELNNFKGSRNYEYSNGEKEGIYFLPRYYNSYVYVVEGVKTSTTYEIQALRINKSGEKDQNYGGYLRDQLVSIGVTPCGYCSGQFSLDPYGRVLVSIGTETITDSGQRQSVIVRLNQEGLIDRTFGDGGKIWINYDYQAGVEAIESDKYMIYGSQYSSSYCTGRVCGLSKMFISQINQLPMNAKPVLMNVSSVIGEVSFSISNFDPQSIYTPSSDFGQFAFDVTNRTWKITNLGENARTIFVELLASKPNFGRSKVSFTAQSLDIEAQRINAQAAITAQRAAEAAIAAQREAEAAAQREAEKKFAREEISSRFKSSLKVTLDTFKQAEITGVTSDNIEEIQAEIFALPEESRSDIVQILKVARKYEVVGKLGTNQVDFLHSNVYVEIGLIPSASKNKVALVSAIRKLPTADRDTYTEIKSAIEAELAKIQARKDRSAAIRARISSRLAG